MEFIDSKQVLGSEPRLGPEDLNNQVGPLVPSHSRGLSFGSRMTASILVSVDGMSLFVYLSLRKAYSYSISSLNILDPFKGGDNDLLLCNFNEIIV